MNTPKGLKAVAAWGFLKGVRAFLRRGRQPSQAKKRNRLLAGALAGLSFAPGFADAGDIWVDPSIEAADVVYSPASGKLYAAVPGDAPSHANSIVAIDPQTGAVEAILGGADDPQILEMSDDFSTL